MPKIKKRHKKKKLPQNQEEESYCKNLEKLFASYVTENDLDKLEDLLSIKKNLNLLKKSKFFDPFVIAVKADNLDLIEYFSNKGFCLKTNHVCLPAATKLSENKFADEQTSNEDDSDETSNYQSVQLNKLNKIFASNHCRALIEAIKCSNENAVDLLINLNINVNSVDYKLVPLQIAYTIYSCEKEKSLLNSNYDKCKLEVSLLL